ncbi:MAG: molybdenum cofactor guanylyltransferase [Sphingomicrobium sp.]
MTAVVILAGGEGRRIGGDKPQRLLGGRSLLDRAMDQARAWSTLIAISSTQEVSAISYDGIPLLHDSSDWGPIAGIASALTFARQHAADRVLTIPCDTPFLPSDLRDRLEDGLTRSAGAALATSGERLHPTCGLWRAALLDDLSNYVASGRASLHGFAEAIGAVAVEWSIEPFDPFFNINAASDLAEAEVLLKVR